MRVEVEMTQRPEADRARMQRAVTVCAAAALTIVD